LAEHWLLSGGWLAEVGRSQNVSAFWCRCADRGSLFAHRGGGLRFAWLIRASWWIRGSIVHRINRQARIHHDLFAAGHLTTRGCTTRSASIMVWAGGRWNI